MRGLRVYQGAGRRAGVVRGALTPDVQVPVWRAGPRESNVSCVCVCVCFCVCVCVSVFMCVCVLILCVCVCVCADFVCFFFALLQLCGLGQDAEGGSYCVKDGDPEAVCAGPGR